MKATFPTESQAPNIAATTDVTPKEAISQELQEKIRDYIFLPSSNANIDIAICLGCTCYVRAVEEGLSLYHAERCRKILFTGGQNPQIDGNEAMLMAREARERGIPSNDILIDSMSRNTLENSIQTLQLLKTYAAEKDLLISRIGLVSIHYHSRRALETFRLIYGSAYEISTISYPSIHYTHYNWHKSKLGRRDVHRELERMVTYLPNRRGSRLEALLEEIRQVETD